MLLGFTNTKKSNSHELLSLSNLPLLFNPTSPFLEGKIPHIFLKNRGDPAMINQNHLFLLFVTTHKASNIKHT